MQITTNTNKQQNNRTFLPKEFLSTKKFPFKSSLLTKFESSTTSVFTPLNTKFFAISAPRPLMLIKSTRELSNLQ
jgi:hypothetical protein